MKRISFLILSIFIVAWAMQSLAEEKGRNTAAEEKGGVGAAEMARNMINNLWISADS